MLRHGFLAHDPGAGTDIGQLVGQSFLRRVVRNRHQVVRSTLGKDISAAKCAEAGQDLGARNSADGLDDGRGLGLSDPAHAVVPRSPRPFRSASTPGIRPRKAV